MMPLSSVLFCVYNILTGNESGSPSDVFLCFLEFLYNHNLQLEQIYQESTN